MKPLIAIALFWTLTVCAQETYIINIYVGPTNNPSPVITNSQLVVLKDLTIPGSLTVSNNLTMGSPSSVIRGLVTTALTASNAWMLAGRSPNFYAPRSDSTNYVTRAEFAALAGVVSDSAQGLTNYITYKDFYDYIAQLEIVEWMASVDKQNYVLRDEVTNLVRQIMEQP